MKEWLEWMDNVRAVVSNVKIEEANDILFDTLKGIYKDQKQEKNVRDILIGNAYKDGHSVSSALSEYIKWLIGFFDYSHILDNYKEFIKDAVEQNQVYGELLYRWVRDTRSGKTRDWFGSVYEETFQGKGKADALGQFYTPDSICRLIGEMNGTASEDMVYSDCCCGSGRLLLSVKTNAEYFSYYIGEDVDIESVRMCALNLMIHNKRGMVVCHDSLTWGRFIAAYEVNECNSPFECGLYCIREISQQEAEDKLSGKSNAVLLKERMLKRAIMEREGKISRSLPFYVYANEYAPRQSVSNPPFGMKISAEEQKKVQARFEQMMPFGRLEIVPEETKIFNGQYLLF